MIGLIAYSLLTFGLGGLMPRVTFGERMSLGAHWLGGYGLMVILSFICLAVLRLSPTSSFIVLSLVAIAGLLRIGLHRNIKINELVIHPIFLFTVVAGVLIIVNGGIDYLPYAHDEFSHWLANPVRIHHAGGYFSAADQLHLLGYLPSWHFILLLPWQVFGDVVLGQSAAAPFVLHLALAGLVFDIVRHASMQRLAQAPWLAYLIATGGLLLYLAAEGSGKFWIYTILIEQPQIYAFTAMLLYLYAWEICGARSRALLFGAGMMLLAGFLLKSAALSVAPAIAVAVLIRAVLAARNNTRSQISLYQTLALLLGPIFLGFVAWGILNPATEKLCIISFTATFSDAALAKAAGYDAVDLAQRFGAAVGSYIAGYKTPVFIAALLGLVLMFQGKRYLVPLILAGWFTLYLGALYWYHLTCFGDYYFEVLNSIPRLTRVVLQPLHAIGLIALLVEVLRLMPNRIIDVVARQKVVFAMAAGGCLVLATWQVMQLNRTVVDVSTRTFSTIDPRIAEARRASNFIVARRAQFDAPPVLQIIAQGTDFSVIDQAIFFSITGTDGALVNTYDVNKTFSWSDGQQANIWQTQSDPKSVRAQLEAADVIWPINADPWQWEMLDDILGGTPCPFERGAFAMVKEDNGFECYEK